jgi:hypothetical protein
MSYFFQGKVQNSKINKQNTLEFDLINYNKKKKNTPQSSTKATQSPPKKVHPTTKKKKNKDIGYYLFKGKAKTHLTTHLQIIILTLEDLLSPCTAQTQSAPHSRISTVLVDKDAR